MEFDYSDDDLEIPWGRYGVHGWWPVLGLSFDRFYESTVWVGETEFTTTDGGGIFDTQLAGVTALGTRETGSAEGVRVVDAPTILGEDPESLAEVAHEVAYWATLLAPLVGRVPVHLFRDEVGLADLPDEQLRQLIMIAWGLLHMLAYDEGQ